MVDYLLRGIGLILLLMTVACSTQSHRARQYSGFFDSYSEEEQQRLLAGRVALGDTREMVYIALGSPLRQVRLGEIEDARERWEYLVWWEGVGEDAVLRTSNDFSIKGLIPRDADVIWLVEFLHGRVVFSGEDPRASSERPPIRQRMAPMSLPRTMH